MSCSSTQHRAPSEILIHDIAIKNLDALPTNHRCSPQKDRLMAAKEQPTRKDHGSIKGIHRPQMPSLDRNFRNPFTEIPERLPVQPVQSDTQN